MLCKPILSPWHLTRWLLLVGAALLLLVLAARPCLGQTCPHHQLAVQQQLFSQQLQLQAASQYQAHQQALLHSGLYQQLQTHALASQHAQQQALLNSALCQHIHRQSTAQLQAQQQSAINSALYQQIKAHAAINHQSQLQAGIGATAQMLKAHVAASAGLHTQLQAGNSAPTLQAQLPASPALTSQQSGSCLASAQLKQQALSSSMPSNPVSGSNTTARYLAFQQSPPQTGGCSNFATLQQQALTSSRPYHHHHHHYNPYAQMGFGVLASQQSSPTSCMPCQQSRLQTGAGASSQLPLQPSSGSASCSQLRISGGTGAQSGMALALAATNSGGVFSGQGTFGACAFSISSGTVTDSSVTLRGMMQFPVELAMSATSPLEIVADRQTGAIIITWMTPTGGTVRQLATGTLGY